MKYLFTAQFTDGSFIYQDHEDTSHTTPGRNAFYDVLQRLEEVAIFSVTDGIHVYSVTLHTGQFEIDGVSFTAGDPRITVPHGVSKRLVYFKRNTVHFNPNLQQTGHDVEFHVGFQFTVDGNNHQYTIALK